MGPGEEYRRALRELAEWEPFLVERSGLPGPRGNLELAAAVAEQADEASLRRWAALGPAEAPFGSAEEFLPVCGVVGLGRLLAAGDRAVLADVRRLAADPRWRIREAVAIALQRFDRWITRENLRKKRLERMDREWIAGAIAQAQHR